MRNFQIKGLKKLVGEADRDHGGPPLLRPDPDDPRLHCRGDRTFSYW